LLRNGGCRRGLNLCHRDAHDPSMAPYFD
jgi:hypothetical protein